MAGTRRAARNDLADRVAVGLAREPHVNTTLEVFYSRIRLVSASGGLESVRLWTEDDGQASTRYEPSLGHFVDCPARLTPSDARRLAAVLLAYADSHPSTGEDP